MTSPLPLVLIALWLLSGTWTSSLTYVDYYAFFLTIVHWMVILIQSITWSGLYSNDYDVPPCYTYSVDILLFFFFSLKPIVHRILLIKYNETILCYNWVDIAMKLITQIKLSWLLPCLLLHCRHYVSCTLPFSWLQLQQSMWISTYFWCWRGPVNGMSTPVNNSMLLYVTRIAIVIT